MSSHDLRHMCRALELAGRGQGFVEPNPMVGCVIARDADVIAEGWHQVYGGPHAEVEALRAAGERAVDASLYVTLEPCTHTGKTPPCCRAILDAGIDRVLIAQEDPNPQVAGGGAEQLRAAGLKVQTGLCHQEASQLNAPFLKLVTTGRPWVIAKWAMTLDGRIASRTGDSRWISGEASRKVVHQLRGRVDGILVGKGTVARDDPLLTARPSGAREAVRIVADSAGWLPSETQLVQTARQVPVLVAVGPEMPAENRHRLIEAGCQLVHCEGVDYRYRLEGLLDELGRRQMTNLLVEGGAALLGSLFDARAVDEIHVFVSPRLIGGSRAAAPIGGEGIADLVNSLKLRDPVIAQTGSDVYICGRLATKRSS